MTTAEAIAQFREKLGMDQEQLGEKLGVSGRSIRRYEAGQEPRRGVLKKLADLASHYRLGAGHLADFFASKWRADVVADAEKLPSTGSARRVSVSDLEDWENWQEFIVHYLRMIAKEADEGKRTLDPETRRTLGALRKVAEIVIKDIQVYLRGAVPKKPMTDRERKARLQARIEKEGKRGL